MPTEKQSAQARINGAKSKRNRTLEDKTPSSRNNLRHARCAIHAIAPRASIDTRLHRQPAMNTPRVNRAMEVHDPILAATSRRPSELNRLYQAANPLLSAIRNTLSTRTQLRKKHLIAKKAVQIIEPQTLNPENDPWNEPGTNPRCPCNSNKTRRPLLGSNPRQPAKATCIPPESITKVPFVPGDPPVNKSRMADHSCGITPTAGSPIDTGLLS